MNLNNQLQMGQPERISFENKIQYYGCFEEWKWEMEACNANNMV